MLYIIGFTRKGLELGQDIKNKVNGSVRLFQKTGQETEIGEKVIGTLHQWTKDAFLYGDVILFIGACGIAVRSIAPFLQDKWNDPAVLVMDEGGNFCISLLSGHAGGGNAWCEKVAEMVGACAVITTATDVGGMFAVDVFAVENNFYIKEHSLAKEVSAAILAGEKIPMVFGDEIFTKLGKIQLLQKKEDLMEKGVALSLESEFSKENQRKRTLGIYVGVRHRELPFENTLHLIPVSLTLGLGCKKGSGEKVIEERVEEFCHRGKLMREAFFMAATIDLKKEEPGLLAFTENFGLPLASYPSEKLSALQGSFHGSSFVKQVTGVDNVCERSALACALDQGKEAQLLEEKYSGEGVTVAAAIVLREEMKWDRCM
ncbi:MAG: cobalamin biosynthesis protein [Lachnospiraceae bacterium]|nr:cobalamin biosynthesis protein [Lachnospiraceae bacterium]MDE6981314.1 cobalamin biosynthesis protein [Lachnospiraceae bacterium]